MRAVLTAAVAMALVLAGAADRAVAGRADNPLTRETLQDNLRCTALSQQFDRAAAQRAVDDAAKQQASQGAVLCRAGRFGEGADTLEKAVRMIGETPAK
jgi:hypothetical protein